MADDDSWEASEEARLIFRLRLNLRQSYAERLQTLVSMIEFNERAEASDPRLRHVLSLLRARAAE